MLELPWVALAVALLPLPIASLTGARVLRRTGEATFPEEWWRHRVWMGRLAIGAWIAAIILSTAWTPVWMVVTALASWTGNFATHKRLHGEAWSLGEHLLWRVRRTLGPYGYWLLYIAAPAIIAVYGSPWALPLLVVLALWQAVSDRLALWSVDAQPLADAVLTARFAPIIEKATCPEPRVLSIGPRRGFFANAFAVPGPRRGTVLLTDTLLRNLEPAEVMGIFAHEMAHLEEHTPRKTAQLRGWTAAWMVFSILLTWAAARQSQEMALLIAGGWVAFLVGGFVIRQRKRRHHEAASDVRAVELCGDVEAVIAGLTRLNDLSRTPRRWDSAGEARLTHPSLARRIQALRAKYGGSPVMPITELLVVRSRKRAGHYFVLGPDAARWLTGVPQNTPETADALLAAAHSARQIPYEELTAIHVRPALSGPLLVFQLGREETGAFPIHRRDVAAVQAALDRIDIHLAVPVVESATPAEKQRPRLVTGLALVASLFPGITLPASVALAVAFALPAAPTMAAASATALAAAVAAVMRPGTQAFTGTFTFSITLLGALGCMAAALAFRGRGDTRMRGPRVMLAALLGCLLVAGLPILLAPRQGSVIYVARYRPSFVVSLAGLAALLAFLPRRGARLAALAVLGAAGGVTWLGISSRTVFDLVDPLRTNHPPRVAAAPRLLASLALDHPVDRIRLSPDGLHFVARERPENANDEEPWNATFLLGTLHEPPVPLSGEVLAAGFVAADRLAIYEVPDRRPQVRIATLDGHDVTATPVDPVRNASLLTGPSQWAIVGDRGPAYARLGASPHTWPQPSGALSVVDAGSRLVYVKQVPLLVSLFSGLQREDVIVADGPPRRLVSRTPLETRVQRIPGDSDHVLYFAADGSDTVAGVIDAGHPCARPVARLRDVIVQADVTPDLRIVARTARGGVLLFNARTGAVARIAETEVSDPVDVAINGHIAAVVQWTDSGSQVLFYATDPIDG